jgi:predicted TIM-barrel fold metal-dependent hydrolase
MDDRPATAGPAGPAAFDCHVHVIDPLRHPVAADRERVPEPESWASAEELAATLAAGGMAGALIVQPSCYKTDNRALLAALEASAGRDRGIAAVALDADEADLYALQRAGVVGVRLNLVNFSFEDIAGELLPVLLSRLARRGWWAEIQCRAPELPRIAPALETSGVRVLFDHVGYPDVALGLDEPGFRQVLDFGRAGRAAIKLSGAFRTSREAFPHADLDPFAATVLAAFGPDRCVWGSDWPFLWMAPRPRYRDTLATLERWVPDPADRRRVLHEAPAALFGFGGGAEG